MKMNDALYENLMITQTNSLQISDIKEILGNTCDIFYVFKSQIYMLIPTWKSEVLWSPRLRD